MTSSGNGRSSIAGTRRTSASFFVVVVAVLVIGVVTAQRRGNGSTQTDQASAGANTPPVSTVQSQTMPAESAWNGELLFLRGQSLVGRRGTGSERIIFTPSGDQPIGRVTLPVDGKLWLEQGNTPGRVVSIDITTGTPTPLTLPTLELISPRPGSQSYASVAFSNAERDYGFTVQFVDGATTTRLTRSTDAITGMSWRADGDVLAVAAQSKLVLVTVTGGDATTVVLPSPIHSISWNGSDLAVLTTQGAFLVPATTLKPTPLKLEGTVSYDLVSVGADRYVWLSGEDTTRDADLVYDVIGQASKTLTKARRIIGVTP